MGVALSTAGRAGAALGIPVLGLALSSAAYLWWGVTAAALLGIAAWFCSSAALATLYQAHRPLRGRTVPLYLGLVALLVFYGVGVIAVRDVVLTATGTEADGIVAKAWTTHDVRSNTQHHCTLTLTDGTPIPREFSSNCEGLAPGDTIPIVFDPDGRFPPVGGPKSDMNTAGEVQVLTAAALVLLLAVAMGAPPHRGRTQDGALAFRR